MAAPSRSDHVALLVGNVLHVWGGLQYVNGEEIVLPSDEIWLYDLESGNWAHRGMGGEVPPLLSQTCGSYLCDNIFVFGGQDSSGPTNQMYCVNLQEEKYTWRQMKAGVGTPPSPRNRHSCWVYKNRLIYFGGYGCKTVREVNNENSFTVDETSWVTNVNASFHIWGWNNEVHVFEPESSKWTKPETRGTPPEPRASHASASLDDKGYICGGLETKTIDIYCLDLIKWTWTQIEPLTSCIPVGRSLHTLTTTSHNTLFLFGGLSMSGHVLSDGWEYDISKKEWRERQHDHKDKPRFWHTAAQWKDNDVVVFGGSREFKLTMDSISVLRSPSQSHCGNVLLFQTQPYSLSRLCEDCIGQHASALGTQMAGLPPRVKNTLYKRTSYFKTQTVN